MSVKLLNEYHLEFLSVKGGCTGWSQSTFVKIPNCWKSHVTAQIPYLLNNQRSKTTICVEIYSKFVHIHPGTDTIVFVTDLIQLFHNQETTLAPTCVTLDKPLLIGQDNIDHMTDEMNETRDMIGCPTVLQIGLPT